MRTANLGFSGPQIFAMAGVACDQTDLPHWQEGVLGFFKIVEAISSASFKTANVYREALEELLTNGHYRLLYGKKVGLNAIYCLYEEWRQGYERALME